jgi:DMSO/TMAO reductase YedYZ molybdopterin-dependent catalytic subunit
VPPASTIACERFARACNRPRSELFKGRDTIVTNNGAMLLEESQNFPAAATSDLSLTTIRAEPFNAEAPLAALEAPVTPTDLHFVRRNFALPAHDGRLTIGGAVANPFTLTLDDLRRMPRKELAVTLECAGNARLGQMPLPAGEPWTGNAVSTARWSGALLHEALAKAQPLNDGIAVSFAGADHGPYHGDEDIRFVRSLSLAHALDPAAEILIAYEMNGEPLNAEHGAPFRLVVPRWYAVASVKWLARISVLIAPFEGTFQTNRYVYEWPDRAAEPVTLMLPRAKITSPASGITLPAGSYTVRGKAWSGSGPITNVEVSFAGEGEWYAAKLEAPMGRYQWRDWSFVWHLKEAGRHTLRARATDADGNVQPDVPRWNRLGYGNNAVELIHVHVEAST